MKIKCIYKNWIEVPKDVFPNSNIKNNNSEFYLDVNKQYNVYGITIKNECIWYYLCDRCYTYYPKWKPSPLFEVVDSRLSKYWIFSYKKMDNYIQAYPIVTFPEWANNHPDFYDKLSDGEEREVEIFKKYKELMDLEFPDSSITEVAQIIADNWLMCPFCIDAWESKNEKDALIKCHTCNETLNNPRYKNTFPHI